MIHNDKYSLSAKTQVTFVLIALTQTKLILAKFNSSNNICRDSVKKHFNLLVNSKYGKSYYIIYSLLLTTGVCIWHSGTEIKSLVVFSSHKQEKQTPVMQLAKGVASKNYNYI